MPISAAGRAESGKGRDAGEDGFTLVELMVVLVIVGLVSSAVMLAMPDASGGLATEAQRFAARASAAQERAIMDNRSVALRLSGQSYGFERSVRGSWQALEERPFTTTSWDDGTAIAPAGQRIVFDSTGFAEPVQVVLSRNGESVAVDIGAGGEIRVRR